MGTYINLVVVIFIPTRHITTHSTGARIESFSWCLSESQLAIIRRARLIRALDACLIMGIVIF
jgi:hypothetical protein